MKVLVVGLGSIARKHIHALRLIEPTSEIFALRSRKGADTVDDVINLFSWNEVPSDIAFIIISNPTSEHGKTIERAVKFDVPLFVEKPPFMSMDNVDEVLLTVRKRGIRTYTAFNLRFHPVVLWLKQNLQGKNVLEVQSYCGSYLPEWRPGKDYRTVYSSHVEQGGGVHLDLIHELDYLVWLFGYPNEIFSDLSKISSLEITSPDQAHYWLRYDQLRVSILLNYFRRDAKRTIEIVMEEETWLADLLKGTIKDSKDRILVSFDYEVKQTYVAQMNYFLKSLQESGEFMNALEESSKTLKLCLNAQ